LLDSLLQETKLDQKWATGKRAPSTAVMIWATACVVGAAGRARSTQTPRSSRRVASSAAC